MNVVLAVALVLIVFAFVGGWLLSPWLLALLAVALFVGLFGVTRR